MSSDASHITQPSIDGPVRAVRMALAEATVNPEEVDYINAHGTGTRVNDVTETQVIKEVFRIMLARWPSAHEIDARPRDGCDGSYRDGGYDSGHRPGSHSTHG